MYKEKILIKPNELKETIQIITEVNSTVNFNEVAFADGIISKLKIDNVKFDDNSEVMFIRAFMGNMELALTITHNEDYVIEVDRRQTRPYYYVRKAQSYDY